MLQEHYDSYRQSIARDALEGFVEHAKSIPTSNQERWSKVYDYLRHVVEKIQIAIRTHDESAYRGAIKNHQECMVLLFTHMVDEYLTHMSIPAEHRVLDMIQNRGWKWFKFAPLGWDIGNVSVIPRLSIFRIPRLAKPPMIYLDSDEWQMVLNRGITSSDISRLSNKKSREWIKILPDQGWSCLPLDQYNQGQIRDWTLDLFPK